MMPTDPNNGSRLDRMERMLDLFIQDHARFEEDHRQFAEDHRRSEKRLNDFQDVFERDSRVLLTAQVLLTDEVRNLSKHVDEIDLRLGKLAEAQVESRKEWDERHRETDARISALIRIVDDLIRKRPPLPPN